MGNPDRKLHRLPAYVYSDYTRVFFFTLCARHLSRPFLDPDLASAVIDSLLWVRTNRKLFLPCYCLMPDHLHFVTRLETEEARLINAGARGTVAEGILDHIGTFKRYTTRIWWQHGGQGKLWQRSSYDHAFRYGESVEASIGYVLANPVRKGLVENWEDYPYAKIVDQWW